MKAQIMVYSGKKATLVFDNGDCWQADNALFSVEDIAEFNQIISRAGEVHESWLSRRGFKPIVTKGEVV